MPCLYHLEILKHEGDQGKFKNELFKNGCIYGVLVLPSLPYRGIENIHSFLSDISIDFRDELDNFFFNLKISLYFKLSSQF